MIKTAVKALLRLALTLFTVPLGWKKVGGHRFLIPAYTGLGNFILKTPFVRALREEYPDAWIGVLYGNSFGTEFVLSGSRWINETLIFPMDASLIQQIRFYWGLRGRYSAIFLPFDLASPHPFYGSILAGISSRIGHTSRDSWVGVMKNACLTHAVPIRPNSHEVDLNFDLLEPLFKPNRTYNQHISVPESLSPHAKGLIESFGLKTGNYIVLQLSAANGQPSPKTWPADHFRKLIRLLLAKGEVMVAVGDKPERAMAENILRSFDGEVLNLVGETTIPDVAFLIKNSRGLLCHDSGLMHIGNALEKPLIAIFGPTNFVKNRPLQATSHIVRSDLPCAPCLGWDAVWSERESVAKCPAGIRCMQEITPEIVFEKMVQALGI